MKEIALVRIGDRTPPLGLLYIGNALKKSGYNPIIYHIKENEIHKVVKRIVDDDCLFVGFSVMTGIQTKLSAIMSEEIKNIAEIPIFWGGPHPTLLPEQCLNESFIDGIVLSEGEETVIEVAKSIEKNLPLKKIKGIVFKENGRLIKTPPREFITNLDGHNIDWSLIDVEKYIGKEELWGCERVIPYVTSRGCPFNCAFCYNLVFNQRMWRCHSIEHVIKDINFLKSEYGIDGIKIFDDNFFVNINRAFDIIEAIKIPYHCELRADIITEEVAKKLGETNAKELLIGAETGSERLMKLVNKGLTVATVMKCVKNLSKISNTLPVYSFIVGLPTETWIETKTTIDMILKVHEIDKKAMFTVGSFLPYPGTPLYNLAIELGFKPPEKTEDWGIIERWEGKFELPWAETDKKIFPMIRDYSKFLYFGSNYGIPLLEKIAKYRLSNKKFSFTLERKLFKSLYKHFKRLV